MANRSDCFASEAFSIKNLAMRFAALLEYDGSDFYGWQSQLGVRTVQDCVEKSLSKVANQTIQTICAGRTDAGVHAWGQVVHFDSAVSRSPKEWRRGCNTFLPNDVSMVYVREVEEDFHARYSATRRCYRYIILNCATQHALLYKRTLQVRQALQVEVMHSSAQALVGEHDFSSFRAAGCQAKTPLREIFAVCVRREEPFVIIDICANAFLQHMVRNIVGCLVAIGTSEQPSTWLAAVLACRDRRQAGVTMASAGLYLQSVHYDLRYNLPQGNNMDNFLKYGNAYTD